MNRVGWKTIFKKSFSIYIYIPSYRPRWSSAIILFQSEEFPLVFLTQVCRKTAFAYLKMSLSFSGGHFKLYSSAYRFLNQGGLSLFYSLASSPLNHWGSLCAGLLLWVSLPQYPLVLWFPSASLQWADFCRAFYEGMMHNRRTYLSSPFPPSFQWAIKKYN